MSRLISKGEYNEAFAQGGKLEYDPTADIAAPATVASATTYTSQVIVADGLYDLVIGVTLSQAGNLKVQRFVDLAGTIPIDTVTVALVAATAAALKVTDGCPMGSYKVQIQNTGAGVGTVTGFAALAAAH